MQARDVMTKVTWLCHSQDPLWKVAETMKSRACGFLPVFDESWQLSGVVTDRDLGLSLGSRPESSWNRPVSEVMTKAVVLVHGGDDIEQVLQAMELAQVRRVVVVEGDVPAGIVSLTGLAERAEEIALDPSRILRTFRKINERIPPETRERPAIRTDPDEARPA